MSPAILIDQLLCCPADQTDQQRHNLQVLSCVSPPCQLGPRVQFDTHLS